MKENKTRTLRITLTLFILAILIASFCFAEECAESTEIYIFYSRTCPHCSNEIEFLKSLQEKYPEININYMEYSVNFEEFKKMADKYSTTTAGVPRTFIGNKVFIGFSNEEGNLEYSQSYKAYIGYQNQIESSIIEYFNLNNGNSTSTTSSHPVQKAPLWILLLFPLYLLTYLFLRDRFRQNAQLRRYWISGLVAVTILSVFLLVILTPETVIRNFASSLPFPLFVFVIALADGFNPCAFTVLIILLSLLTYTKEKKTMFILGVTFIVTSAVMYFIFITAMILVGSWAIQSYGPIIMKVLGMLIIIAGTINLKDYFLFKKGVSLSISDNKKSRFTRKASRIVQSLKESQTLKTLMIALGGTIVLAAFVNLVELGCTAILPAIYMVSLVNTFGQRFNILHVFWTLFYSAVYILPLLAILFNFIYTFKSTRLTENQGRILKLISGLFMLVFGIIMIFNPELLMFA